MKFDIAARAILGKRSSQQDSWRVFDDRGTNLAANAENGFVTVGDRSLVIVADGVGGYAGGEEASKLACDEFAKSFFKSQGSVDDRLKAALGVANSAIAAAQREHPDKKDMSTTFIGIYLDGNKMTFVSVGDSLLLRYRDEEIHRVNLDHSYADVLDRRLLGVGSADPREWSVAINDDQRAAITLALSGGPLDRAEYGHAPQIATRALHPGDVIIAASDGIETIELVQLQNFVRQLEPKGAIGIVDGLIKAADGIGPNRRREPDNTTIVIVHVPDSGRAHAAATTAAAAGTPAAQHTVIGRVGTAVKHSPTMVIAALAAVLVLVGAGLALLVSRPPSRVETPRVTTPGTVNLPPNAPGSVPGAGQDNDPGTGPKPKGEESTTPPKSTKAPTTPGRPESQLPKPAPKGGPKAAPGARPCFEQPNGTCKDQE
jgi:protein phosphatase